LHTWGYCFAAIFLRERFLSTLLDLASSHCVCIINIGSQQQQRQDEEEAARPHHPNHYITISGR
jgi:hypothetical protein